jgi:D-hexose-6-phosphate mutarotase
MTQSLEDLQRLLRPGVTLSGDDASGPIVDVEHGGHRARISLFGGHVFDWQPAGEAPVLWLSSGTRFDRQRSIRGGTPVCWPWFAVHPEHADWPMHGFARNTMWRLESVGEAAGQVTVRLGLPVEEPHARYFAPAMRPTLDLVIGDSLTFELVQTNAGNEPVQIGQALHTYFEIGDIAAIEITGLEANRFIDKLVIERDGGERAAEGRPITVSGEIDRIYRDLAEPITLVDHELGRRIEIVHEGASNAVVWNPWVAKTERLGDMGTADAYRTMMCIETGNVPPEALMLAPGETHRLTTRYRVQ